MPASRLPHPTRTRALELLAAAAFIGLSLSTAFAHDAVDVDETTFPWSSVGKIYNSARSSCTGSLIARDKVLTAAHCLFNRATHRFLQPDSLHFLLGYKGGEYRTHLRVARHLIEPHYDPEGAPSASIVDDWAILMLAEQAGADTAPLPLADSPAVTGERIMIGGFSQKYPFKMTADVDCRVRGVMLHGLIMHDCAVMHGLSGAPIIKQIKDGEVQVLGVHVATGTVMGLATGLAVPASSFAQKASLLSR
jgi:protease YdgD